MLLSQRIWAATLLLLPLVITFGTLVDAVSIPRITLLLFSLSLISIYLLVKEKTHIIRHTQTFFSSAVGISLSVYLIIGLCSIGMALSVSESIWEWLKIFIWLSSIYLSTLLLEKDGSLLLFTKSTLVALFVVELIGLQEFVSVVSRLEEDKILYLVNSTFEHKNLFATGLVLSIPLGFAVWQQEEKKLWKGFASLVMGLAAILILVTQSRAAWLASVGALFFGFCCLLFTPSKRPLIFRRKYITIGSVVLCLSIGLVWFLSSKNPAINAPTKRIQALFTYEDTKNEHTETIKERLLLWNNTLKMIKEEPVLGVGLGNWKIHFPKYNIAGLRSEQGEVFFQRPHNDYLWIASEMGIGGLLAYLAVLFSTLFYAFRILKESANREDSTYTITLAMTSGLVAFLLFSLFDFPKERPIHLLWSGFIIAFINHSYWQLSKEEERTTKQQLRIGYIAYIFPLIALGGLFFVGQRWQAERALKVALNARSQQQYLSVLTGLENVPIGFYELDPSATPIDCYRGEALYLQNRFPEALAAYQAAHKIHPYHIHTLNNLATTYFGLQNVEAAKEYFEQVLHFAPHFPGANMNMAAVTYNQKDIISAVDYIGNCVPKTYEDAQFLQFLNAISIAYANLLKENKDLEPLYSFIDEFGKEKEWQIRMHQQAHQYNRTYKQQIHLDLLFVAKEQQAITEATSKVLTPILNKLLNH